MARAAALARLASACGTVLREPIVHVFAVGIVLFLAYEYHTANLALHRIEITPDRVSQLTAGYAAQFGEPPSERQLDRLVEKYVNEEVLYREGLARGLDRGDEIVRRRVVQKMEFLEQDLATPSEASESELSAFFAAHAARYAVPASVSFSQVYFADRELGGSNASRVRAAAVLDALPNATLRAPERGDIYAGPYDYSHLNPEGAERHFGDSELSRALYQAPVGHWAGPFRSAYGWHLVRVVSSEPAAVPSFEVLRARVRDDLIAARQNEANDRRFAALKARFTVIRADEAPPSGGRR